VAIGSSTTIDALSDEAFATLIRTESELGSIMDVVTSVGMVRASERSRELLERDAAFVRSQAAAAAAIASRLSGVAAIYDVLAVLSAQSDVARPSRPQRRSKASKSAAKRLLARPTSKKKSVKKQPAQRSSRATSSRAHGNR